MQRSVEKRRKKSKFRSPRFVTTKKFIKIKIILDNMKIYRYKILGGGNFEGRIYIPEKALLRYQTGGHGCMWYLYFIDEGQPELRRAEAIVSGSIEENWEILSITERKAVPRRIDVPNDLVPEFPASEWKDYFANRSKLESLIEEVEKQIFRLYKGS